MIDAQLEPRNENAAVSQHRVARVIEDPLGNPDLGVDRCNRCPFSRNTIGDKFMHRIGRDLIEIPPIGAIRNEQQRTIGRPLGLRNGFIATTGNNTSIANNDLSIVRLIVIHRRDAEFSAIPRHIGMIPAEPCEHVAGRIHARCSNKV